MEYIVLIAVILAIALLCRRLVKASPIHGECRTDKADQSANCPYCKFPFEKKPQRNRKCPQCGSRVFLRKKRLLTEHQAEAYDRERGDEMGRQLDRLRRRNLVDQRRLGSKYVTISAACDGITCEACMELDGKRVLVKDELQNPTLPVKNCTSEFCRCCYKPSLD